MPFLADSNSVKVTSCGCLTPFGDAAATCAALLRGEKALKPVSVAGVDGGDLVPVALLPGRAMDETNPPAWGGAVKKLFTPVAGPHWGTARRPIFVTSSNFGVGNLHAFRKTGDTGHLAFGSPMPVSTGCAASRVGGTILPFSPTPACRPTSGWCMPHEW